MSDPRTSSRGARLGVRVCLVYDCFYPNNVGGVERWYRRLAERLVAEGHTVTYLTLRPPGAHRPPAEISLVFVGRGKTLYSADGRRRLLPAIAFGVGVLFHLLRHGHRYDAIHTSSASYFGLLAAATARLLRRYELVVDWFEVWTKEYWREYLGPVGGWIGWNIQKIASRLPQRAFTYSQRHRARLRELGLRGTLTQLSGLLDEVDEEAPELSAAQPIVVFAGRHIPEKQVPQLVRAFPLVIREMPSLRLLVFGDGPEHSTVTRLIRELGLESVASAPGFVPTEELEATIKRATCLVLPSRREGYGLVIAEAAAAGTPSVVVEGPDNASVELVTDGVNGRIAPSADPADLATAIVWVARTGDALRRSTREWYAANARRLSISSSLEAIVAAYSHPSL